MSTETAPRLAFDVLKPTKDPTPREAAILDEVHGLALAYADLPPEKRAGFLVEVQKLTTGYDRNRATMFTPPGHPVFGPLMALLDGLIASTGIVQTRHGAFTVDDLREVGAMTVGSDRIRFPIGYGATGVPIFRPTDMAGFTAHPFRAVLREVVTRPASMWGDGE